MQTNELQSITHEIEIISDNVISLRIFSNNLANLKDVYFFFIKTSMGN